MYYSKMPLSPEFQNAASRFQILKDERIIKTEFLQAYAIGIGYSYDKCKINGLPTKFIKITTPEMIKWLSQAGKNIITENKEECNLGK